MGLVLWTIVGLGLGISLLVVGLAAPVEGLMPVVACALSYEWGGLFGSFVILIGVVHFQWARPSAHLLLLALSGLGVFAPASHHPAL